MTKKYEIDMCSGSILRKMIMFAFPLMGSAILQLLFNAADIIVVGRFVGENALAAVGACTALVNLLIYFINGLSIGTNVLAARFYGAKKEEDLSQIIHTSMVFALISGVFLTVCAWTFSKPLLVWMKTPEEILPMALLYFRVYCLGITATTVYNFSNAILRAVGDTRRPLYYLTAAGIINLSLNLVLVICFDLDVFGVAIATIISQYISAALMVRCMLKEQGVIRIEIKKLAFNRDKIMQILVIGLPASVQEILFAVSGIIIQASINTFGTLTVAGCSIATNIEGFIYAPMSTFYQAAIAFAGQNIGARKYRRIDRIYICAESCAVIIGLLLGNLAYAFGEQLLGIYTVNSLVIEEGMKKLAVVATTYALSGMMDSAIGVLSGLGYTFLSMGISILGICGMRIAWVSFLFQVYENPEIQQVYAAYPLSWGTTFLIQLICYFIIRRKFPKDNKEGNTKRLGV